MLAAALGATVLLGGVLSGCSGSEEATGAFGEPGSPELRDLRQENRRLEARLDSLQDRAATGQMRRGETVEVLSTDLHFKSGSADLSPEGVEKLEGVAERIKRKYPNRNLRVEGFTDSRPIGERLVDKFPSNWELSAARAAAVVRHLRWTHDMAPERFEVVGFGPHQPVATNETAEGRRQNRRVRIAVLPPTEGGPARDATGSAEAQRR
jgi:chemotaxis protein MotB